MKFKYTGTIQTYTVTQEGLYTVQCWGASGGGPSRDQCGLGAYSRSKYYLHNGDILKILVASKGEWDGSRGGGGGGSFVELNGTTLLCAAGGGGGSMFGRAPNKFSHGQAGKYAGNYKLDNFKTNVGVGGDAYAGSGGGGYSGNGNGMTCTPSSHAYAWIYGGISFKNGGSGGYGTRSTNAGGFVVDISSSPKGGFGGGGGACFYAFIGNMSGVGGYYYNGAGGGGGYSGGDSTRDSYGNTAGGGSSYFLGDATISFAKSGDELMPLTSNLLKNTIGNFGDGFVNIVIGHKIILTDCSNYYILTKEFLDIYNKKFKPLTLSELKDKIINNTYIPASIDEINKPIVINQESILPYNILDFSKCKLCFLTEKNVNKAAIEYTPSQTALLKSNIKIKDKFIPMTENLSNTYLDIAAYDKSDINYSVYYDLHKDIVNKNCNLLNTEIIKDNFYLTFKFDSPDNLLKSVTLYKRDKNNHLKINDKYIDISNDYENTYITFVNAYSEILINRITRQQFKYLNDTLDKF